jgi:hypothetical protein
MPALIVAVHGVVISAAATQTDNEQVPNIEARRKAKGHPLGGPFAKSPCQVGSRWLPIKRWLLPYGWVLDTQIKIGQRADGCVGLSPS